MPLVFAGIDFMINLHGCIAVFEKKKVGMLEEAGKELMVNGQLIFKSFEQIPDPGVTSALTVIWSKQMYCTILHIVKTLQELQMLTEKEDPNCLCFF